MGDNGKMYVPNEMLPVYKDTMVTIADIFTPNQFEMELLTGTKITNLKEAGNAISILHNKGAKYVLLSSSDLGDENNMLAIASVANNSKSCDRPNFYFD